MKTTTIRVGAVAFAAMLVLTMGAGVVLAASPTVDTEATETSDKSALNDGDTVDDFNASDENISTLQVDYDSDNPGIKIVDPATGEVIKTVTNSSNPSYFTVTNATADYYNTTFQESDFAAMPMDAGENKSVELRLVNNTSHSAPDTTNITIYLNNTNERAVVYAGDAAKAGDATTSLDVENDSTWAGFGDEIQQATVEHDNLGVSGADTTIYVLYAESNASDAYSAAPDRALWGSYSDGEFIASQQVWLAGQPHAVYRSEVPDVVNTDVTHGVTTTVDGYDAVQVNVGDHYSDDDQLDVEAHANDKYRIDRAFGVQQDAEGTLNALSPMSVSGVGSGQLVA